jgi:hypothetical protein
VAEPADQAGLLEQQKNAQLLARRTAHQISRAGEPNTASLAQQHASTPLIIGLRR